MYKWLTALFVGFIGYVIYLANIGADDHFFFRVVRAVPLGDKIGHLVLIGTLALLGNLAIGFRPFRNWSIRSIPVLWGTVVVTLLVVGEEVSQIFIANRTFDLGDLFFDFVGICVANWAAAKIMIQRSRSMQE